MRAPGKIVTVHDVIDTVTETAAAKVQGLYGPFAFPEKLLQKIWSRREFDLPNARMLDGRKVTIVHPGRWNLLGGPDFKNVRLRFGDGAEVTGDVELHLHASDWTAHGHAKDPAYNNVVLHVVLFPPAPGHVTIGVAEREIPVLVVLPLLLQRPRRLRGGRCRRDARESSCGADGAARAHV